MPTYSFETAQAYGPNAGARSAFTPLLPTSVGRYRVIARLGQGGMGEVFLGVDEHLHGVRKLVAIKVLHAHLCNDAHAVQAFLEEGRVALGMNHAGIVQSLDVGEVDGRHYLVMEFLHGQSLLSLLTRARQQEEIVPMGVAVRVVFDALEGLHHMHEACSIDGEPLGLVHCDVCPNNLFVTYRGETKLLDFGISKRAMDPSSTQAALLKGKLCYLPPELAGGHPPDARSDVWSMGVVLWEVLTGDRLFEGPSEAATLQQVLHLPVEDELPRDGSLPGELVEVLSRALQRNPADRYANAGEMREDLGDWLGRAGRSAGRAAAAGYLTEAFTHVIDQERRLIREQLGARDRFTLSGLSHAWAPRRASGTWKRPGSVPPPVPQGSARSTPPPRPEPPPEPTDVSELTELHEREGEPIITPLPDSPSVERISSPPRPPSGATRTSGYPSAPRPRPSMPPRVQPVAPAAPEPRAALALPFDVASMAHGALQRQQRQLEIERRYWGVGVGVLLLLLIVLLVRLGDESAPVASASVAPASTILAAPAGPPPPPPAPESEAPKKAPSSGRKRTAGASRESRAKRAAPSASSQPAGLAGFLTLDTQPWSEVWVEGRMLGRTPIVDAQLPAGVHDLSLKNPGLGITSSYRVTIQPGARVRKRLAID